MSDDEEAIDELIEQSSLGALAAKVYRDSVSDDQVDEVMRRLHLCP